MIDLNNLKQTNDTKGHDAGDTLIINICNILDGAFGIFGKVYRIGVDEIAVVIINHSENEIKEAIELFNQMINEHNLRNKINIDYALGYKYINDFQTYEGNLRMIMRLADARMYEDKTYQKERKIK